MKKLILATTVALLAGCTVIDNKETPKPIATSEQLVGQWECFTEYRELSTATLNQLTLNQDGTMENKSIIFDNTLFSGRNVADYLKSPIKYGTYEKGKWNLDGNQLSYMLSREKVERLIKPEVLKKIQQNKKLNAYEQKLFEVLNKQNKDKTLSLEVIEYSGDAFGTVRNLGDKKYISVCSKPKQKNK